MTDLTQLAIEHQDLPEEDQKKAGQAIAGDMNAGHEAFMKKITELAENGTIDLADPESFLTPGTSDEVKNSLGLALPNIADQTRRIVEFYRSRQTPDSSPHLETMVEHLWQMKSNLEAKHGDILKI